MNDSTAPERAPILPEPSADGTKLPKAGDSSTSGAVRIPQNSATSVTYQEMPAVRESAPPPPTHVFADELSSAGRASSQHSSRLSWTESHHFDPPTDTGRVTSLSLAPVSMTTRDRPLLLRMEGVHAGQVFELSKPSHTIGRHPDNDIVLDDTGVSRHHAEIIVEAHSLRLIDKGARNGTNVQGHKVHGTVPLEDGDHIQFGPRVSFRFTWVDAKQHELLERLYESSNRDALTGAYNRKHFTERLDEELAYSARHGSSTALLLFDIDHFKKVNDTYGHAAGDAVLRNVSAAVASRLRTEDVFARVGGEEFAVLLRGVNLSGSARLAERLRAGIAAVPTVFDGQTLPVTVSIGCAAIKSTKDSRADELIRLADERLYQAKHGGRNRVVAD